MVENLITKVICRFKKNHFVFGYFNLRKQQQMSIVVA